MAQGHPATLSWREQAIAMFPYLKHIVQELQDEDFTVYTLFFALLPLGVKAHRSGSQWELQRIYDYAEWCWRQGEQDGADLSNAVGVAFYEHLSEHIPLSEIRTWVKPDIFDELHELFEDKFAPRVAKSTGSQVESAN